MLDIQALRSHFPALSPSSDGATRVHLDNAGTTCPPRGVIEAVSNFYARGHSAASAASLHENARTRIARALGARDPRCVVFCTSATHAIHLAAAGWGEANIGRDDEIIASSAEHVANLACWQALARRREARLRVIPVNADGGFPIDALRQALSQRTKLVAITHVSNVSGAVSPIRDIVTAAHAVGACVLIDGAQAVAHMPVDFDASGADFYAFSGHKAFAGTGIGVLLGKPACLDALQPAFLGANAFDTFTLVERTLAPSPQRFEGGTANVAGALAMAQAFEFIELLGWDEVAEHERRLCAQLDTELARIEGVSVLGSCVGAVGIRAFVVDGQDAFHIQQRLQDRLVDLRAGNLSAQTLLRQFGTGAALRASLAVYNDADDIDRFVVALAASLRRRRRPNRHRAPAIECPG